MIKLKLTSDKSHKLGFEIETKSEDTDIRNIASTSTLIDVEFKQELLKEVVIATFRRGSSIKIQLEITEISFEPTFKAEGNLRDSIILQKLLKRGLLKLSQGYLPEMVNSQDVEKYYFLPS